MTFININKSNHPAREVLSNKSQAIFEYFLLTAVVVAAVLFFASSGAFQEIGDSCEQAFEDAVEEILE